MNAITWDQLALAQAGPQGGFGPFVPLVLILLVFYFLLVRPQQQRAKQHQELVANLKRGDWVVAGGGIYGKVLEVRDADVTLEICERPQVKVRFERDKISGYDPAKKSPKQAEGKG